MNRMASAMSVLNGLGAALGVVGVGAKSAMSALDVFKSLTSDILSGFKSLMGGVLSALKGILNFAVSLPKMVMTGIGRLSDSVLGAMGNVARSLSSLLTGAATVGIGAMTVAITGLVAVTSRAVTTFASLGRTMASLSSSTGLSKGASGDVLNRFSALGIKPGETASMFGGQNPTLYGMRAGMFGLPSYTDPRFAAQTAAKFQAMQGQGVVGQMLSQQMLRSLNLDNDAGRRMVSMSPQSITEQQRYASSVNQSLGLDPSRIAAVTQQWDALTNKAQTLTNGVLLKLADAALPYLNRALDVLTRIGQQHANGLGGMIEKGVQTFAKGVGVAFEGLLGFAKVLMTLPDAAFAFADSMLAGLQNLVSSAPSFFDTFLTGVSVIQAAVEPALSMIGDVASQVPQVLAGLWDGVTNGVNALQAGMQTLEQIGLSAFNTIGTAINNILSNPTVQSAIKAAGAALDIGNSIAGFTDPARRTIKDGAESMGVPSGYSDLASFAAMYFGGKAIFNGVLGNGTAQVGARGLGLMANPGVQALVGGTAVGIGAGYGLYTAGQNAGLIDREQSWWDRMETGVGRIRSFVQTGDMYNLDRQVNAEWAAQRAASQKASPTSNAPLAPFLPSLASPSLSPTYSQMYQRNLGGLGSNSWANQLGRAPQILAGWAGHTTQSITDWASDTYKRGTSGHGGWARSLDERWGTELRERSNNAAQNIGQKREELQDKRAHFSDETKALLEALDSLRKEIRELRGVARENVHATRDVGRELPDSVANVLNGHAKGLAQGRYLRALGF